jgi:hypothetical protein
MGRFTKIPQETFNELEVDAGVLLNAFDPATPTITDAAIICATTGGINISCVPTFSDWGEDVDNCPNNTKELKHLDEWTCSLSTTCLQTSAEAIKLSLGAATTTGNKIVPDPSLDQTDFTDAIWWVGDRSDGGFVAVKVKNVLSTGGFSLQTTKKGKGQYALELTGHYSIDALDDVPMEFYVSEGAGSTGGGGTSTNP